MRKYLHYCSCLIHLKLSLEVENATVAAFVETTLVIATIRIESALHVSKRELMLAYQKNCFPFRNPCCLRGLMISIISVIH